MPFQNWCAILLVALLMCAGRADSEQAKHPPADLKPPVEDGIWLRPSPDGPAEPVIGLRDGLRIALWPAARGPRGLIRICTPYVFPDQSRSLINFIAVEPIVGDWRSLSELEHSSLDDRQGLRMWLSDTSDPSDRSDRPPWNPSRGKTSKIKARGKYVEVLTVFLNIEKLDNGAQPVIQVTFRSDRPNEVGFKVFAAKDSAKMESCVLSATMGNYARTRLLWLKDEVVDSRKVWPDYSGNDFVGTDDFPLKRIRRDKDGSLIAAITPNEKDPASAQMPPGGWPFLGKVATQYWRKYPGTAKLDLRVRVNGRAAYWGSHAPIPGGVAFENFEFIQSFTPGEESWFGVTLKTPYQMGWKLPE